MIDVGNRIKQLREKMDISGRTLAKKADLDPSQISKIEKGVSKPSLDALGRICETLNITLADFFSAESDEIAPNLQELLNTTDFLTSEQLKLLNSFLKTFRNQ